MKKKSICLMLSLLITFSILNITSSQARAAVLVTGIEISQPALNLPVGSTYQLQPSVIPSNATNKSCTYLTSDSSVASVSSTGLITAKKHGMAYLKIRTVDSGFEQSLIVVVRNSTSDYSNNSHMEVMVSPDRGTSETNFQFVALTSIHVSKVTLTIDSGLNRTVRQLQNILTNSSQKGWRYEGKYSGYHGKIYYTMTAYDANEKIVASRQVSIMFDEPQIETIPVAAWVKTSGGGPLNVRSGPGSNNSIAGQFNNGQEIAVTLKTTNNGFYPVKGVDRETGRMITGWCHSDYISFKPTIVSGALANKIAQLKEKYPHGTQWAEWDTTFDGASQCMGFAYKLAHELTGTYASKWPINKTNLNDLKPGDIIRYRGHSIYVYAVNGDDITFADCNWDNNGGIRWDQNITKQSIMADRFQYVDIAPNALK